MRPGLACALAAIAIASCGAPPVKLEKLPPPADAASAGEVVVIRPGAFIGEDISYFLNVDRQDVFELESRQHTRFKLPAGEHRIAVRCFVWYSGSWTEAVITQSVVAGQTAYLAVEPKHNCASLDPVPESEGRKLLSRTHFKPSGQ